MHTSNANGWNQLHCKRISKWLLQSNQYLLIFKAATTTKLILKNIQTIWVNLNFFVFRPIAIYISILKFYIDAVRRDMVVAVHSATFRVSEAVSEEAMAKGSAEILNSFRLILRNAHVRTMIFFLCLYFPHLLAYIVSEMNERRTNENY